MNTINTYTNPWGQGLLNNNYINANSNPFASTTKKIGGNTVDPSTAKLSTKTTAVGGSGKGMSAGAQNALSAVGSIAGAFSNMNGSLDEGSAQTRESIRGAIGQFGPWGAVIAAATGVVDTLTDQLGVSWETVDKSAADRAGAGTAASFNNMLASLPGNSIWGVLMSETDKAKKSQYIDQMSSSYSSSAKDIDSAQKLGDKRVLFGKNKMNDFVREQNRVNSLMTSIGIQSELARQNDAGQLYQIQNMNKYSGYSPKLLMAKSGMKLHDLEDTRTILWRVMTKSKNVSKFQLGGKIVDPSKNIIPDGALHKNRNHLSERNEELQDQITEKGIPVVSEDKDGNIIQHAEVEVGEVIFNLANTEIIENYWKQYQETGDESIAIECGKFLTNELLHNTVDKAGIKNTVE